MPLLDTEESLRSLYREQNENGETPKATNCEDGSETFFIRLDWRYT